MDALETALVERLSTANADADVPRDLAWRVLSTVRRRRRRRTAIVSAVLVAVVVTVPVTLSAREPHRAPARRPQRWAGDQPAEFEALVDRASAAPGSRSLSAVESSGWRRSVPPASWWVASASESTPGARPATRSAWWSGRRVPLAADSGDTGPGGRRTGRVGHQRERRSAGVRAGPHDDWQPVEVLADRRCRRREAAVRRRHDRSRWTDARGGGLVLAGMPDAAARIGGRQRRGGVSGRPCTCDGRRGLGGRPRAGATVPLAGVPASALVLRGVRRRPTHGSTTTGGLVVSTARSATSTACRPGQSSN